MRKSLLAAVFIGFSAILGCAVFGNKSTGPVCSILLEVENQNNPAQCFADPASDGEACMVPVTDKGRECFKVFLRKTCHGVFELKDMQCPSTDA